MTPDISDTDMRRVNVLIVGGSLAGLMNGIVLSRLGHQVTIFETTALAVRESQAAGLTAGPYVREFLKLYDRFPDQPLFLPCSHFQFLNYDTSVKRNMSFTNELTSWDALYTRLRLNFDGGKEGAEGKACYVSGRRVTAVLPGPQSVKVSWESSASEKLDPSSLAGTFVADFVIAADGANSVVKRSLSTSPSNLSYAGYVAWRGTVPESSVPKELRPLFQGHISAYMSTPRGDYILVYHIPGPGSSFAPGSRLFNFVWYSTTPEIELPKILTDTMCKRHHRSVPAGLARKEVWHAQLERARKVLPPEFLTLVEKVEQPFIHAIDDGAAPEALIAGAYDRILLAGEALTVLRPQSAQGANRVARGALLLREVAQDIMDLRLMARTLTLEAKLARAWSVTFGTFLIWGAGLAMRPLVKQIALWLQGKLTSFWWTLTGSRGHKTFVDELRGSE